MNIKSIDINSTLGDHDFRGLLILVWEKHFLLFLGNFTAKSDLLQGCEKLGQKILYDFMYVEFVYVLYDFLA